MRNQIFSSIIKGAAAGLAVAAFLFFFISSVSAQEDKYGLDKTSGRTPLVSLSLSKGTPQTLAQSIVSIALMFVGTVFFGLVLYAGFKWMMARGAEQEITKAKEILEMAVIGLLIVAASYAISTLIFNRLSGVSNGQFFCHYPQTAKDPAMCLNIGDTEEEKSSCADDGGTVQSGSCTP